MPKIDHRLPIARPGAFYVGVDPGESGSATILDSNGLVLDRCRFQNSSEHDMVGWFQKAAEVGAKAALEKVRSSPQQGVTSAFTFGWNYGLVRGILAALRIPFEEPTPQVWQRGLAIPPRSKTEEQADFKRRLRSIAQEKWPGVAETITLDVADSMLIAEWLRRQDRPSL